MARKHNGRKRSQRRNKKNRNAAFAVMRETYVYVPESKGAARKFEKEMKDKGIDFIATKNNNSVQVQVKTSKFQNHKIKKYRFSNFSSRRIEISIHREYSSCPYHLTIP